MKKYILSLILVCVSVFNTASISFALEAEVTQTFTEEFADANWASDWTTDSEEHTWDGSTMVTFADSTSYPTDVAGSQLTAKLTLDTTNADKLNNYGNSHLAVQFQNVDDPNNFLILGFADNNGIYSFYNGQAYWQANWQFSDINNIRFNGSDKAKSTQTYIFELTDSALTITEEGSGDQTVFEDYEKDNGDGTTTTVTNFSTFFKPDAIYKVGIYASETANGNLTKVDRFEVTTVKTVEVGPMTAEISQDEIDTKPGSEIDINFSNKPNSMPTDDNLYIEDALGNKVSTIVKQNDLVYKLKVKDGVWLEEGKQFKAVVKNIEDDFGQTIDLYEKALTSKTYATEFTISEVSKVISETEKEKLETLKLGTYTISAKLLPNKSSAQKADIAIMVCEGTEEKYRVVDMFYFNQVSALVETPAEITVGEGEFLKLMSVSDFATGKLASDSVVISQ